MMFRDRTRRFASLALALAAAATAAAQAQEAALEATRPAAHSTVAAAAAAPTTGSAPEAAESDSSVLLLQKAMRARISISTNRRTGGTVPAYHCRHAPEGCDQRLTVFARYLTEAGQQAGVDPWLLAAMAFRESGFNPFAMGSLGELGILQLHPKNPRSKEVRFLHDDWYRKRCRKQSGACQREVVERAAQLLASSVAECGNVKDALGAYNTGRCGGNPVYSKRILGERKLLRDAAGLGS